MVQGNTGGRPAASVIINNFTRLASVSNKSGHYFWKSNYCPEGSPGAKIEGRDNKHVKHLTDPRKCPNAPGINVELTEEIESTFSYTSPLTISLRSPDDFFEDPEDFSLEGLEKEFEDFEKELREHPLPDADGAEVLDGEVYDFNELDRSGQPGCSSCEGR